MNADAQRRAPCLDLVAEALQLLDFLLQIALKLLLLMGGVVLIVNLQNRDSPAELLECNRRSTAAEGPAQ